MCFPSVNFPKTGELHQQATCYVYVLQLRNVVLKLPTACVASRPVVSLHSSLRNTTVEVQAVVQRNFVVQRGT